MAYNEKLADRLREVLSSQRAVEEKKGGDLNKLSLKKYEDNDM